MTDLRQAAKAVVERWDTPDWEWRDQGPTADLMADLRTALEQPEQEPVAWVCFGEPGKRDIDFGEADINELPIGTLLYTAPPAAQRPWQGLEAEDLAQIESDKFWQVKNHMAIAMAVEAKLKAKNDH